MAFDRKIFRFDTLNVTLYCFKKVKIEMSTMMASKINFNSKMPFRHINWLLQMMQTIFFCFNWIWEKVCWRKWLKVERLENRFKRTFPENSLKANLCIMIWLSTLKNWILSKCIASPRCASIIYVQKARVFVLGKEKSNTMSIMNHLNFDLQKLIQFAQENLQHIALETVVHKNRRFLTIFRILNQTNKRKKK